MGSQKITIYDIAREAGVSITTVSRALANSGKVKQETYSRIMRIVQKYHFQPNEAARILAESKTKIIGVMVSQIENPFYAHMFIWCERIAEMYGYSTILANSMGNLAYEHKLLDKLAAQQVAAVIQFGGNVDACVSDAEYVAKVTKLMRHTPFVVSGKLDGVRCCRVQINDSTGIRLAVTHLAQLGHRRIALIGGSEREVPAYQKAVEFRRLIDVYGLCRDEDFICIPGSSSDAAGYECMERLIAKGKMPSAIISINDFVAAGVMQSLSAHGFSVPEDVSIISFDDTFISRMLGRGLTTVSYDYELVCSALIAMAVSEIEKRTQESFRLVEPFLICRNSTRPPKN